MDEIKALEELLANILSNVQSLMSSGEAISDELQTQTAEVINQLISAIQELETTPIPELEKAPYQSAVINAFKYDPKSQNLFVKFQGDYPLQNGSTYVYSGIPKFIANIFAQGAMGPKTTGKNAWHAWFKGITPSHGAALNALLKKGGFGYTKLT